MINMNCVHNAFSYSLAFCQTFHLTNDPKCTLTDELYAAQYITGKFLVSIKSLLQ